MQGHKAAGLKPRQPGCRKERTVQHEKRLPSSTNAGVSALRDQTACGPRQTTEESTLREILISMAAYCPIGPSNVDQTIVRGVAFLTLCSVAIFLAYDLDFILVYLLFDFFMRGFLSRKLSVFVWLAQRFARAFACKIEPVNAEPKVFAARIGFIACLLVLICKGLDLGVLAYSLSTVLMLAAAMESFFSVCLGCHIYTLINHELPPSGAAKQEPLDER